MKLRNIKPDPNVIALVCPACTVILEPTITVNDCTLVDEFGVEEVSVIAMRCPKCGGGVGLACMEEK